MAFSAFGIPFSKNALVPDALAGFERPVGDDRMVADDRLAGGQDLGCVVRVPRSVPERDEIKMMISTNRLNIYVHTNN